MTEYKPDMEQIIGRLESAQRVFYDAQDGCGGSGTRDKSKLVRVVEAMPFLGEAIAVIESVPPRIISKFVKRNIIHQSIVREMKRKDDFFASNDSPLVLCYSVKMDYLDYLQGKLDPENKESVLYHTGAYSFENMARACRSAGNVCRYIDEIDSSPSYWR